MGLFGDDERWRKWEILGDFGGVVSPLFPHIWDRRRKINLQNEIKRFRQLFKNVK